MHIQYITFDTFDKKPTKEDILKALSDGEDEWFDSFVAEVGFDSGAIAKEILEDQYAAWEMYQEDESIYIVVINPNKEDEYHVHRVSVGYVMCASSKFIEIYN
ncbi:hypothetical protein [Otariodibacter oris]|uniref:Uncharacterized protein n=1 Tax=Otariodibacter oris TaxID=1032623 RepID=A0A420XJ82_9PAST|nr:hypothetical protein [Otariodibacter oris]QGM80688.1 hypothetical protein A6A10_04350 [Otariodibacter oris]RKR77150.1 hypothetical protein DES31_0475 [Otariodibacter oris]